MTRARWDASVLVAAAAFALLGGAARPAAESLIAGLQVAFTEPIHIDDVVIVEGEWGKIEEITSTYVVVRIWDLRRLVVPLRYFLEKPFQNWTRSGTALLAQVTFEVDYSTPVAKLREQVGEIVVTSKYWDKRFWERYPWALPRIRATLEGGPAAPAALGAQGFAGRPQPAGP